MDACENVVEFQTRLKAPITKPELFNAMSQMQEGKALGYDGVVLEFFKVFGEILGTDYHRMICSSISQGRFPEGVTRGLITLLFKARERKQLGNWRPITLLTIAYKIYAKALLLRLQPILLEIINQDQSAFLPTRFILDNIMLTQETMDWAKSSQQPLPFLKLDFFKAYDKVDWLFLFATITRLGFPSEFISMTKLLFGEASASVRVNGCISRTFPIEKGVRQGCPLAPYLFLIIAEALNAMVKVEEALGNVRGITLL